MLNTLNTLSRLPGQVVNHPVAIVMQEAALNVFAANVNVLQVARAEGRKVYGAVREKAGEVATREVKRLKTGLEAANDRVNTAWDATATVVDNRLMPVLDRVGLATPAQFGLDLVGKGLQSVSAKVVELTREPKPSVRRSAKKPVAKPAAKKVVAKKTTRRGKLAA